MIYADLHTHSIYSDGIYEPEEVVKRAKEKGIKWLAICDHDTLFHQEDIKKYGEKYGVNIIKGIEMSCYNFKTFKKIHILGLFLNDDAPNVTKLCNKTLNARDNYHRELIKEYASQGYNISYEDAKKYSPYNAIFKMDIFSALKEKNPTIDYGFYKKHFQGKVPIEVELKMDYIDIKEGIEAILADGGLPILAHPSFYNSFPEVLEYIDYGILGIEINHHSMKEEDKLKAIEIANKYNLVKSGGSDFHRERYTDDGIEHFGHFGLTKEQFEQFRIDCKNKGFEF